jgi:Protein of unknown function (DUF3224)
MATKATAEFQITSWDEKPYSDGDGQPKLTRASVTEAYSGDFEGDGAVEYLMIYREDGSAAFARVERLNITIGDRSGSFVTQGDGSYSKESGVAEGPFKIVEGTGTGDLKGIKGEGSFSAKGGPKGTLTLEYSLDSNRS